MTAEAPVQKQEEKQVDRGVFPVNRLTAADEARLEQLKVLGTDFNGKKIKPKKVIAYYQLHSTGIAVPVYCDESQTQSVIENAHKKEINFFLPGHPIPEGVTLQQKAGLNRKTRRSLGIKGRF